MPHAGQQVHAIDTCDLNTQNRGELDIFWKSSQNRDLVVGVAQLVELRIVVPAVVGSSPIAHPNFALRRRLRASSGQAHPLLDAV